MFVFGDMLLCLFVNYLELTHFDDSGHVETSQ